jgi:hypothetical protein
LASRAPSHRIGNSGIFRCPLISGIQESEPKGFIILLTLD